jgi:kanamycin kinase
MLRTPISADLSLFPDFVRPLLDGAALFDSSCSPEARVFFIERDGGYYLKRSPKGTLEREARMTRYFHTLGLSAEVLAYQSLDEDWLLTARVAGEDMTHPAYLSDPLWLCDTLAESLRMLHDLPYEDCPVSDHTSHYLATAEANYRRGLFDPSFGGIPSLTPDEAWQRVVKGRSLLQNDTLLHGDYCLPNILFDNRNFTAYRVSARDAAYRPVTCQNFYNALKTPLFKESEYLEEAIYRSVSIKRDVVEEDEFDTGKRQLLNFGHTLGHSIEKLSDFTLTHGACVAKGMYLAAKLSADLGFEDNTESIEKILVDYGFDLSCPFSGREIAEGALSDKKRAGAFITAVLVQEIGKCTLFKMSTDDFGKAVEKLV